MNCPYCSVDTAGNHQLHCPNHPSNINRIPSEKEAIKLQKELLDVYREINKLRKNNIGFARDLSLRSLKEKEKIDKIEKEKANQINKIISERDKFVTLVEVVLLCIEEKKEIPKQTLSFIKEKIEKWKEK